MWIMLNDAFLSIVSKDCGPDELLVRARREGDIEKYFPKAVVIKATDADYLYRAVVSKGAVLKCLTNAMFEIDYPNFKDSVEDELLHDCYLDVWQIMTDIQPTPPYSGVLPKKEK